MTRTKLLLTASFVGLAAASSSTSAQTLPSPHISAVRYDVDGRVTGTIAPDPDGSGPLRHAATRTSYDEGGRPYFVAMGELANWQSEAVAPSAWVGFTTLSTVETSYDSRGRKLREVTSGADGEPVSLVQYSYDTAGRLECTAVRMNPAVYWSLPSSACALGTAGDHGPDRITKFSYDAAGQLLKEQRAYDSALQQDYATYSYSPNGKRTSLIDARSYKASMTYDGHDRQVRWNFPVPTATGTVSATDYEEYGYDPNGNRTSLRKRDGSVIAYQFDALNRNTVKVVPERSGLSSTHTRDVYYGYDLRGLQTYARFDGASTASDGLTSSYDGFGRLSSSSLRMDGVARTLSYAYNKNGNRTELTWSDATKTSYAYDDLGRVATLFEGALGSATNMVGYGYNQRGVRSTQTGRFGQVTTFGHDPAGRPNALSHNLGGTGQDVVFGYTYTPASQMAQRTRDNGAYAWMNGANVNRAYAANGLNQYTSAGAASFTYDANGNLTSDGSTTYTYDIENRLVSAAGSTNATLRYDPLGRLYETAGSATTRLLHDGDELVAEYDAAGTLLRRYVHGQSIDDPVVWYEGTGTANPRWLHIDHQGSVIAVTDATGNAIATNSYDEWGIPGINNLGRFQYTGQAWVAELGMYYYKARIYSPTLGRFLQTDPIGYEDQVNLYSYVGNDPLSRTDPKGLADLNLFDKSDYWYGAAEAFEPNNENPHIFTIMGHASDKGMHDQRNGANITITPAKLLEMAIDGGFRKGDDILLTGCNCGQGYAQELANLTKGRVFAGSGFVSVSYKTGQAPYAVGDDVVLFTFAGQGRQGFQGDFWSFKKGEAPLKMGQSAFYDADTETIGFGIKHSPGKNIGLFGTGKKRPFCNKSARNEDCE